MKTNKILIVLIVVFLVLIVGCSKNKGDEIVVLKSAGASNKYEDFNVISNGKEVQKVKDILDNISWGKSKVSMDSSPHYKIHFSYTNEEDKANGATYDLWISPNKDKVELVIEDKSKYVQLDKEKSAELFEIISGNKLADGIKQLPNTRPKDFNFVFNFGVGAKNQLDTTKEQFTKDMVREPSVSTKMVLTEEEMNSIYSEMKKIDIMNYPDNFTPKGAVETKPSSNFSIIIIANGIEKKIYWQNVQGSKTKAATQLKKLLNNIFKIIINKEEFKKLPPAKDTYA